MRTFLRLEAVGILVGAVVANIYFETDWRLFALFAILPDLSLLTYIGHNGSSKWPAVCYNLVHIYAIPILLVVAFWSAKPVFLLGWVAHIALDRILGYGLKSFEDFKITHIQRADAWEKN